MKLAAVIVLAFVLITVLVLFLAAMALSATRRARLRGDDKGMDFSDTETVRFSKEIMDARHTDADEEPHED